MGSISKDLASVFGNKIVFIVGGKFPTTILRLIKKRCLTMRAPDGWDSARFSGLILSYESCPFWSPLLPSRR